MSKVLRILLVEDDEAQIDSFNDAVNAWNVANAANERKFNYQVAGNVTEAESLIQGSRIDCALIDIRIPASKEEKPKHLNGNQIINSLLLERGLPIGVISANMSELEPEIADKQHVRQFDKGDENTAENAVCWLAENWSMMEVLDLVRHRMEQAGAEIFGKRLWPQWNSLPVTDPKQTAEIVARQYASHLVDKLGLEHPENIEWHPYEAYVSPSFHEMRAHTGDIFQLEEGHLWIVVSPQCDMATQKIPNAILCICEPGIDGWDGQLNKAQDVAKEEKRNKALDWIRKKTNQEMPVSKHFLPPLPGNFDPLVVNFSAVRTMSLEDLNKAENLNRRKASVSSPFLANVAQRFGAYISRTGQPNIDPATFSPTPKEEPAEGK
ncbi:hypothetical protein [Roseibium sp.]|uniref:hypothetical protein n=1 Tax=Roseibium sp. TaxID=1936156 RepID=UPI003BB0F7CD